jgi:hypothetical protein
MSIRPNPLSQSPPILVRSARHKCEAAQLGELHAANPKTPETTPSHQIQILAHSFAYVLAQVLAYVFIYVLAYVPAYVFIYVLAYVPAYIFTYVLAYVPTSALSPQVATGCHLDGSGRHANGPSRSAVATGCSAVATGCPAAATDCHPEGPGHSAKDPKPIPYSESLPDQLRRVQPMCTTSELPDLPADHDPSGHRR